MVDFKFKPRAVFISPICNAMRRAVCRPLLAYGREQAPRRLMARLRRVWQARLVQLRDAGWQRITAGKNFQYARNCPPFAMRTRQIARTCGLRFCPFCHARRYVLQPYLALAAALDARPGLGLLEVSWQRTLWTPGQRWSEKTVTEAADLWCGSGFGSYTWPEGAVGYRYRRFDIDEAEEVCEMWHGGIVLMPERQLVRRNYRGRLRQRWYPVADRPALAAALGRLCRYPAGLLRANVSYTIAALQTMHRARASVLLGCSSAGGDDVCV